MNVYIPSQHTDFFLKKLKEIRIVDDYTLDRSRFGKEKIQIRSRFNSYEKINHILPYLPENSLIVAQTEYPGKEYVLCVGEVSFSDFFLLQKEGLDLSVLTRKASALRFNAWVHLGGLEKLKRRPFVREMSSINGRIDATTHFVFEGAESDFEFLYENVSRFSDALIIKERKIYVKLLLHDFTKVFKSLGGRYEKIDIVDEGEENFI